MKLLRGLMFFGGLVVLFIAFGFIFRLTPVIAIWPWEDGRYSYLFIGSILAAVSAAALWIGWTGEFGALPAGTFNVFVIALFYNLFSARLTRALKLIARWWVGNPEHRSKFVRLLLEFKITASRETRPIPALVKVSFWIFIATLLIVGRFADSRSTHLPWALNPIHPSSSVVFFLRMLFCFLYGVFRLTGTMHLVNC
ncbi:MAG: hypothetical protein U0Z26_15030 [Anaerolineales bacterium]